MSRITRSPVPVECTHEGLHTHGTATMYKRDRCGCDPCRAAENRQHRRRRLDAHIGAPPRRVDAARVRDHLIALKAAGVGYRAAARADGVSDSTVVKIMRQDPGRADGGPQRRVTRDVAAKILAVRPSLDVIADGGVIDATGTIRRIQALGARGWSRRALAVRLGVEHYTLTYIEQHGRVTGRMGRAIRDLYEELWDVAPAAESPSDRAGITMTLRRAAERGWAPPMAWDDGAIDDPTARPHGALRILPAPVPVRVAVAA